MERIRNAGVSQPGSKCRMPALTVTFTDSGSRRDFVDDLVGKLTGQGDLTTGFFPAYKIDDGQTRGWYHVRRSKTGESNLVATVDLEPETNTAVVKLPEYGGDTYGFLQGYLAGL
jgi:hypothetical protein